MADPLRALLALCCLALLTVPAAAAPLDRARFAADLCGDGAAQVRGAEGLVQAGGDLPADDLTFAGRLLGALAERRLSCPADGALLLDRPGASEGRDALTGAVRPAAEARAPILGLRQRAAVETARGIIATLEARLEQRIGARKMAALTEILNLDWGAAIDDGELAASRKKRAAND